MMNGFALLVAVALLGQNGGAGWDIDPADGKLQYIVHLTSQEAMDMQAPPGGAQKPDELVLNVPGTLQGRFAKVLVRVNSAAPPRNPTEEKLRSLPLYVANAVGALSDGAARLSQSASFAPNLGVGWDVDPSTNKLECIVHLTPQDILDMSGVDPKEVAFPIPSALQGRFANIVVRADASQPPRVPSEDRLSTFPLLTPNAFVPNPNPPAASGLPASSPPSAVSSGLANIDRERDSPPVRATLGSNPPAVTEVAQNRNLGTPGLANPFTSATGRDRDRDGSGVSGSLSSVSTPGLSQPLASQNNTGLAPGFGSNPSTPRDPISLPNNGFGSNAGLNSGMGAGTGYNPNGSFVGNNGSGLGSSNTLNNSGYNANNPNSYGTNSYGQTPYQQGSSFNNATQSTGSLNPGYNNQGTFGSQGSLGQYGSNPGYNYNNPNGSVPTSGYGYPASGFSSNGFGTNNLGGYLHNQPGSGVLANPAYLTQDVRMASVNTPPSLVQSPPPVPFPQTVGTNSSTLPAPGQSRVSPRARDTFNTSNWGSDFDSPKTNYLPILFLLSFVVNMYAGIYLYKLRDRYRSLLASVRTSIDP